jgi:hypothetical protein
MRLRGTECNAPSGYAEAFHFRNSSCKVAMGGYLRPQTGARRFLCDKVPNRFRLLRQQGSRSGSNYSEYEINQHSSKKMLL